MVSTTSIAPQLKADHPELHFVAGDGFHWLPDTQTITYVADSRDMGDLLHELAHALLGHRDFSRDISLLEMERDAWHAARHTLGPHYGIAIDAEIVESALDTYRDWLHARSLCPHCQATGIQAGRSTYRCLACLTTWRVNDARHCALRRYTKNPA